MSPAVSSQAPEDDAADAFADMRYRLTRRALSTRIGGHRGSGLGSDGRFHGLAPILDHPDPRHIDIAATIRDPAGNVFVRRFRQPERATVFAVLDLSASMGLVGRVDRRAVASLLVCGLARMVRRSGDRFGLVAAGGAPDGVTIAVAANRRADLPAELRHALAARPPVGTGAERLAEAARESLPHRPALVFLVSDFQFPAGALAALLGDLAIHDVRPILLRDTLVENPAQRFGFARLRDAESGRTRTVLTRRRTLAAWKAASERHLAEIRSTFAAFGTTPIEIVDQIDIDRFFEALASRGLVS